MGGRGSAGGRETLRRYGAGHFREIGRRGFQSFVDRYFQGDRGEAARWLRDRAYERQADTFADRELARRLAAGERTACVELPVVTTDDEVPF